MSNVNYSNGKFFLTESGQQPQLLLDVRTPFVNRSRINSHQFAQEEKNRVIFPLEQIVNNAAKKIFQRTLPSLAEVVTYMRIVARLLRKPQIHDVLIVGQRSRLDEALEKTLPKFNEKNFLYCYVPHRPIGKFNHVNFICAETDAVGGGVLFARK